jgi:hypothetical protein
MLGHGLSETIQVCLTQPKLLMRAAGQFNRSLRQTSGCIETAVFVDGALCCNWKLGASKQKLARA